MRGGALGLWLLVGSSFIGAAAVALVGASSQSLIDGARQGALESIGGDLSFRLFHRAPNENELSIIRREGNVSIVTELRPMIRAFGKGQAEAPPILVELKGVDRRYPLYGTVVLDPSTDLYQTLREQNGIHGAVADPALYAALGLQPGDSVQIGDAHYQLRGTLIVEPDRAFRAFTLGPRVMVLNESLSATGAISEGAEVYFYTRLKLPQNKDLPTAAKAALIRIDQASPWSGWRMVNAHDGAPGVERSFAMAHVLMLFIGLGVMLIGGAGISSAVRAHIAGKMEIIAILKSIGAPPSVVNMAIGFEVMAATTVGTFFGIGVGAFGPGLVASALADQIPFALETIPSSKPLFAAGLFGLLVAALFAWWPVAEVHDMKANALLRNQVIIRSRKPGLKSLAGAGVILVMLVALVFWASPMPVITVWFLSGALAIAGLYFFAGIGLSRLAKFLAKGRGAHLRLALSNLYRSGSPTGPVVMALGLTLTLLVALNGIGVGASQHVQETLPNSAPDFVAFSLKPIKAAQLSIAITNSGILERQRNMPFLHARVQAINGVSVRDLEIPRSLNWVIRGDRGVSFAVDLPDDARWEVSQIKQSGFSVDADVAKKLGLQLGDAITLNISGQIRTGIILNLRRVDWTALELNFPIIATPITFKDVPYIVAVSMKAIPGGEAVLETFVKNRFPATPLIRVADVLNSLSKVLNAIVSGLQTAALLCGFAAMVVLVGSVFQGVRKRTEEAVLFKVLGARKNQLLGQLTIEFIGLGLLVALIAVPLGLGISYGIAQVAGLSSLSTPWIDSIWLAATAILVTLAVGLLATLGVYKVSPARILRDNRL